MRGILSRAFADGGYVVPQNDFGSYSEDPNEEDGGVINILQSNSVPVAGAIAPRVNPADAQRLSDIDRASRRIEEMQQAREVSRSGGINLPLLAAAGAMLGPTKTGQFGESLGSAIGAAVPLAQRERALEEQTQMRLAQQEWNAAVKKAELEDRSQGRMLQAQRDTNTERHQRAMERAQELRANRLEQGRVNWQISEGPDPKDPDKKVQGMWELSTVPGVKPVFHPNGAVPKNSGAPLSSDKAAVLLGTQRAEVAIKAENEQRAANGQPPLTPDEAANISLTHVSQSVQAMKAHTADAELTPETRDFLAEQAIRGDTSVFTNLGRGAQGAKNVIAVRDAIRKKVEERGGTGADVAAANVAMQGERSGARVAGGREAIMGMANTEARVFIPLAREASANVKRSDYPTVNSILMAYQKGTGDENVVKLAVATNSLLNAYARAITPTGVPTEGAHKRGQELLDAAWANGQYNAALDQLQLEMDVARTAPASVMEEQHRRITGRDAPKPVAKQDKTTSNSNETAVPWPTDLTQLKENQLYSGVKLKDGSVVDAWYVNGGLKVKK